MFRVAAQIKIITVGTDVGSGNVRVDARRGEIVESAASES